MENSDTVDVKWKHKDNNGKESNHRFVLSRIAGYSAMRKKIAEVMPNFNGKPYYIDEEKDKVVVSNDEEFFYAASLPLNRKLFRLLTSGNLLHDSDDSNTANALADQPALPNPNMTQDSVVLAPDDKQLPTEESVVGSKTTESLSKQAAFDGTKRVTDDQVVQAVNAACADLVAAKKKASECTVSQNRAASSFNKEVFLQQAASAVKKFDLQNATKRVPCQEGITLVDTKVDEPLLINKQTKQTRKEAHDAQDEARIVVAEPDVETENFPNTGDLGVNYLQQLDDQLHKLIIKFSAKVNGSKDNDQEDKWRAGSNGTDL